jgi:hypothetical protein
MTANAALTLIQVGFEFEFELAVTSASLSSFCSLLALRVLKSESASSALSLAAITS